MQLLDRTLGIRPVQLFDHGPWSCRLPRAYVRSAPAVVLFLTGPCQKHSWHRAPVRVTRDRRPAPWLYLDDVPCISENRATSNQLVIHEVWQSTSVPMCSGERGPGERMKFIVWSVETSFGDLARTSGILSLFGYSDVGRWAPSSAMWPSAVALLLVARSGRGRSSRRPGHKPLEPQWALCLHDPWVDAPAPQVTALVLISTCAAEKPNGGSS